MNIQDWQRARQAIRETARRSGISKAQCRADMKEAIDEAWKTTDPAARAHWAQLFPSGKKPTVEEFIARLGKEI